MSGSQQPIVKQQQGVVRGVAIAAVVLATVTVCAILGQPSQYPEDRTGLWLKWNVPRAACLAYNIATVGNLRFKSSADIMGAGLSTNPSPQVTLMRGLLQNTLEQVVLAAATSGSFAVLAPPQFLVLIPMYSVMFVIGRVLFAAGYARSAPHRALGFALTVLPSYGMLACSCVWLLFDPW